MHPLINLSIQTAEKHFFGLTHSEMTNFYTEHYNRQRLKKIVKL